LAAFSPTAEGLTAGELGGIVWQDDLAAFVEALVPSSVCTPSGANCFAFDIREGVAEELEGVFEELSALDAWSVEEGGQVGVAVGFGWAADAVPVLETW
ncbi:MAG: hypothetical protein KC613_06190, partial [Myxococcales bacterium]|nr:hypothetical protein [Myxococcales bacterium]